MILPLFVLFMSFSAVSEVLVDLDRSRVQWRSRLQMGRPHYGDLKIKKADVQVQAEAIKSAMIVIDMTSVTVADLEGKMAALFLKHIKDDDFFAVKRHPESELRITVVTDTHFEGSLKIKDIEKPVKIPFELVDNGYKGQFTFNRKDYKIAAGDPLIQEEVEVFFHMVRKE